jgi:hypothetical protein
MKEYYLNSEEHFHDHVDSYFDEKERIEKEQKKQIEKEVERQVYEDLCKCDIPNTTWDCTHVCTKCNKLIKW